MKYTILQAMKELLYIRNTRPLQTVSPQMKDFRKNTFKGIKLDLIMFKTNPKVNYFH